MPAFEKPPVATGTDLTSELWHGAVIFHVWDTIVPLMDNNIRRSLERNALRFSDGSVSSAHATINDDDDALRIGLSISAFNEHDGIIKGINAAHDALSQVRLPGGGPDIAEVTEITTMQLAPDFAFQRARQQEPGLRLLDLMSEFDVREEARAHYYQLTEFDHLPDFTS